MADLRRLPLVFQPRPSGSPGAPAHGLSSPVTFQHQEHAPVNQPARSAFIWSVADLLRSDFNQSEYGRRNRLPQSFRQIF